MTAAAAAANDGMSDDDDIYDDEVVEESHAFALQARATKISSQGALLPLSGHLSDPQGGEGLGYATKSAMSVQPLFDGDAPRVAKMRRAAAKRGDEAVSYMLEYNIYICVYTGKRSANELLLAKFSSHSRPQ